MNHSAVRISNEAKKKLEEMAKADSRKLANMIEVLVNHAYVEFKEGK
ncbi:CopG family transcriptional regulator [Bacillus sp. AFS031507]|nr:CopG family transcriptional regulator [Bacillus sp. AFS031507]